MEQYQVTLTLIEPILGTVPKDKEVYKTYITDKLRNDEDRSGDAVASMMEEELATVQEVEEKGWTGFHIEDGQPVLYNYVIKGFFKDACGMLRRDGPSGQYLSCKLRAYKKEIDGLTFVKPRKIPLVLPEGIEMDVLERPLRASGPQGERVALARSDTCPAGTTLTFTVTVLGGNISEDLLVEWFGYGEFRGLGQWRNAGWGQFAYEMEKV